MLTIDLLSCELPQQDVSCITCPTRTSQAQRSRQQASHQARLDRQALLQVTVLAGKKPSHGGVPSWFSQAASDPKALNGRSQLEGNRRMLRRQKQHHHSVEDEWLKCHRRCLSLSAASNDPATCPSHQSRRPYIHPTGMQPS